MTDYAKIKTQCMLRAELWEDPDFPATQSSVFYHQVPPFQFVWKRPKEIFPNPTFILDKSDSFEVVPGRLGDKWLVSCISILYMYKGLFFRAVPADQTMDSSYAGVFRFRLWWYGQWVEVLIDDRLPTVNGKLVFLQTKHTQEFWPALLEKAYAKLLGSYEALKYGNLMDGLADLTGGINEIVTMSDLINALAFRDILLTTSIVTASYCPSENDVRVNGLENGMTYRVCDVQEVPTMNGLVHLVLMKKPFSLDMEPTPRIVVNHQDWKPIPISRYRDSGTWILYTDFCELFPRVECVHLDAETSKAELSLVEKRKWHMKMHLGSWRRGVSAGGCRNHLSFFHTNPQIQIVLNEPDLVVVSLNQHRVMDAKTIGFSMYKSEKPLTETATPAFFKKNKSCVNSHYMNTRRISHRCHLEAGTYIIVPTTYEPREEANFSLRIFSMKPIRMSVLDDQPYAARPMLLRTPPGAEARSFQFYESVFLQLADEDKTIDIFELQELLDTCLPNDYIKSCSSIDTCRQIILSMDKKETGRISLSDFQDLICNLRHWQLVFKNHARENMGVLRAERLRDALREVGFSVPERVLALLILRYMRKDGMLRFCDFVSVVMHLYRVFELYCSTESSLHKGTSGDLSEWLKNVLMC